MIPPQKGKSMLAAGAAMLGALTAQAGTPMPLPAPIAPVLSRDPAQLPPELPRGFKVPFYPLTPILGILSCVYLITTVPGHVLLLFLGYLAVGLVIYFFYGMHFSNLQTGRDQEHAPEMGEFPGPVVDE